MSIASEITRLQNAKDNIKTSIENKGVTVPSTTTLDGYSALIDSISSGGGSSWVKIAEKDFIVNTTSTTSTEIGTINCGSEIYTKDKIIYISVRDTAGKRNNYFTGSDTFILNWQDANKTTGNIGGGKFICSYNQSYTQYVGNASQLYGIAPATLTSEGIIQMHSRYNSIYSKTLNGTYHVEVYTLDYPDGKGVFNI